MDDILNNVRKAFEAERMELQARLRDLDAKEAAVIAALTMDGKAIDRAPSVPDDKYAEVLNYLREHPDSRQADVAKDLKLNSGIISTAMKLALARHEAKVDRPGRGARYAAVDNPKEIDQRPRSREVKRDG